MYPSSTCIIQQSAYFINGSAKQGEKEKSLPGFGKDGIVTGCCDSEDKGSHLLSCESDPVYVPLSYATVTLAFTLLIAPKGT